MKIHPVEPGSVDWEILRSGKITASEADALVTPLGKVKEGDGPRTYLYKKLAEIWLGGPLPSVEFWNGEQGQILEEFARPAFALETGMDVKTVGFITTDDERCGCSPDGMVESRIGQNCAGVEIKSPHVETHLGYVLDGVLPKEYVLQVQFSLWVTGWREWWFYSFCRRMPSLILRVEPDKKIQDAISSAVALFVPKLDTALEKLTTLNGGQRPEPRAKFKPAQEKFKSEFAS